MWSKFWKGERVGYLMNKCQSCGHPETDHGPISGRRADNSPIFGRLCFHSENQKFGPDLCPCSGFNIVPNKTYMEVINMKLRPRIGTGIESNPAVQETV